MAGVEPGPVAGTVVPSQITGGALAISTLAARRITLSPRALHALTGLAGTLRTTLVVLWALTMAWLPALLVAEILRPRLSYDVRRWSAVFPVDMYAACSFIVGTATMRRVTV